MNKLLQTLILLVCSATGLHAQQDVMKRSYNLGDYFKLREKLEMVAQYLDTSSRLYYEAIVANAFNKNLLAIQKADSFLRFNKEEENNKEDRVLMLQLKMDSYEKTFQYRKAANVCSKIMDKYGDIITKKHKENLQNSYNLLSPLQDAPPQTIEQHADAFIRLRSNMVGLLEIPVHVGKNEECFLFDTGANISVVSESYAEKLGIKKLNTSFQIRASQGKRVESDLGVADSIIIGNIIFRNVVFIIMPDDKLDFRGTGFRIRGAIGYPVISAMKEIHIIRDSLLSVPLKQTSSKLNNLAMNGLMPIVQAITENDTLAFQFDTGADQTDLFSTFYNKHEEAVKKKGILRTKYISGAGGTKAFDVYDIQYMIFKIGSNKVILPRVSIHPEPVNSKDREYTYGNIGHDVVAKFNEMVMNFESMYIDFKN